ncbi:HIT family protein [candidate division KSB1 bacterium]
MKSFLYNAYLHMLMGEECCELGSALHEDRLICETQNFFVVPTLGSIGIEGYLLIVPKKHHLGFGSIPQSSYAELNELMDSIKKVIHEVYGKPTLIFEHGPRLGELESGNSIDHAHLHVIPGFDITETWAVDLITRLGDKGHFYRVERVEGFERAREMCDLGTSYLYLENPQGIQLLSEQNFNRPSQYFRKMVAMQVNAEKWNWKSYPDNETLEKTVVALRGRI